MEYLVFSTLGNIQSEVLGEYFTDKTLGSLSFLSADSKESTQVLFTKTESNGSAF